MKARKSSQKERKMTKSKSQVLFVRLLLFAAAAQSHVLPGSDDDHHHIVKKTIRNRRSLTLIENQLHPEYCSANEMFLKPRFLHSDDDDDDHHYYSAGVEYAVYQKPGEHAWISPVKITPRNVERGVEIVVTDHDDNDDAPVIRETDQRPFDITNNIFKETESPPIYVPEDDAPMSRNDEELEKSELTEESRHLKAKEFAEIEFMPSDEFLEVNLEDAPIELADELKFVDHHNLDDSQAHEATTNSPTTTTTKKPTTTTKTSPTTTEEIAATTMSAVEPEIKIESRGADADSDSKNGKTTSSGKSSSSLSSSLL